MLTHIILNPDVEDNFVHLNSHKTFDGYYQEYGDSLAQQYETGQALIMDAPPIKGNDELLLDIEFPYNHRPTKKLKFRDIMSNDDATIRKFIKNGTAIKAFRNEASRVSNLMCKGLCAMFPKYNVLKSSIAWRFSVSHTEDLHLDVHSVNKDVHILKAYWNADSFPRIWQTGTHIENIIKKLDIDPRRFDHSEHLTAYLNKTYFGLSQGRVPSEVPHHTAIIAPGTMWIAHGELVPHTVMFGRRMVSVALHVEPKTMINPKLSFYRLAHTPPKSSLAQ